MVCVFWFMFFVILFIYFISCLLGFICMVFIVGFLLFEKFVDFGVFCILWVCILLLNIVLLLYCCYFIFFRVLFMVVG